VSLTVTSFGKGVALNRRQWKKACKKAAAEIERRWPGEYEFGPADGDETVYAPPGYDPGRMPNRDLRIERRYTSPPRGTPMLWERTSYEYDEWDCKTALEVLSQLEFAHDTDWDAIARAQFSGGESALEP
jgi:hypothetical protein